MTIQGVESATEKSQNGGEGVLSHQAVNFSYGDRKLRGSVIRPRNDGEGGVLPPAGLPRRGPETGGYFCHMGIRDTSKKKKNILAHIICNPIYSKSNRSNSNNRYLMAQCSNSYCYRLVLFIS